MTWDALDEADAVADGFATLADLRRTLQALYPHQGDGKQWWRVRFRWAGARRR